MKAKRLAVLPSRSLMLKIDLRDMALGTMNPNKIRVWETRSQLVGLSSWCRLRVYEGRSMSSVAMSRSSTAAAVLAITALLMAPMSAPANAPDDTSAFHSPRTDRLTDLLSDRPGVYLWTNDAPSVVESLLQRLLQTDSAEATDDTLSQWADLADQEAVRVESRDSASKRSQNQRAIAALQALADGIFDGELVLSYAISEEDTLSQSLIAHSSGEQAELESFMKNWAALQSLMNGETRTSDATVSTASDTWSFENGVFLWSDSRRELELLQSSLQAPPKHCLTDNVSFQRIVKQQRVFPQAQATISFFASDEFVQAALLKSSLLPEFFNIGSQDNPREIYAAAFLNELRAVGGQLYFVSPRDADTGYCPIAFDFSTIVTKPRHGVLASVAHRNGLTFDLPVLSRPLNSLFQVEVDGKGLAKGVRETTDRLPDSTRLDYPFMPPNSSEYFLNWHSLEKFDGPTSLRLLEHATRITTFQHEGNHSWDSDELRYWSAIKLEDSIDLDEVVRETLNEHQLGAWASETDQDFTLWSIGQSGEEKLTQALEQKLKESPETGILEPGNPIRITLRIETGKTKIGEGGMISFSADDFIEQVIEQYRERLAKYLGQAYAAVDDWLFVRPLPASELQEFKDDLGRAENPQLEQLQDSVRRMTKDFEIQPCGVLVNWSAGLRKKLHLKLPRISPAPPFVTQSGPNIVDAWQEPNSMVNQMRNQRQGFIDSMDSLIVLFEESPIGFRIVGGLEQTPPSHD